MALLNQAVLAAANTAFNAHFRAGLEGVGDDWSWMADIVPSDGESETYGWLRSLPTIRKWLGPRIVQSLSQSAYTLVNEDFEGTVGVPAKAMKRDRIGIFANPMTALGRAMGEHPTKKIWELFAAGETDLCFDGLTFFNAAHPVVQGQPNYSNTAGGGNDAWYLVDAGQVIKPYIYQLEQDAEFVAKDAPTDDNVFWDKELVYGVDYSAAFGYTLPQLVRLSKETLDATSFDAGIQAMMELKNDRGEPLAIAPTHLVVGPSNRSAGKNLIEAEKLASGATNTNFQDVKLVVSAHLA